MLHKLILTSVLFLWATAWAQVCITELRADEGGAVLQQLATGRDAAIYVQRAVALLEPVLPRFDFNETVGVEPTDNAYEAARYLLERRLLPATWQPDSLDMATWQTMLTRLGRWYGLTPVAQLNEADELTKRMIILTLAELIDEATQQINPVALVASAEDNSDRVAFWAIIRNDGVYPRMIIVAPPSDSIRLGDGVAAILPTLETCAMELENFIFAPASVAQQLFLSTNQSRMIVASASPIPLTMDVPSGEEVSFFVFESPTLAGIEQYAALFPGPSLGVGTILGLIPRVRTNMSPGEILAFLQL
ncbi:MAG: hypothetical protein AAF267_03355 [Deinococcota bacterium]